MQLRITRPYSRPGSPSLVRTEPTRRGPIHGLVWGVPLSLGLYGLIALAAWAVVS